MEKKNNFLKDNVKEINNLNQRSGRMLSLIDLIHRETIPLEVGEYFLNHIRRGANILVAAKPGGAGKTAIMAALLGILHPTIKVKTVQENDFRENNKKRNKTNKNNYPLTYVIHEIGKGGWYGYYWGKPVAQILRKTGENTFFFSNMHPDSIRKIKKTFKSFGLKQKEIMSIDFIIILEYNLRADPSRTIKEIWKPKEERFGKIYDKEKGKNQSIFNEKLSSKYADFLNMCLENRIFKIEKVATTLLDFEKTMPNQ